MNNVIDLERYPLDREGSDEWNRLVEKSRNELNLNGMFNLEGFIAADKVRLAAKQIQPTMNSESHTHSRTHNIYFKPQIEGLAADHPALRNVETVSHTLCADQLKGSLVSDIYEYPPWRPFWLPSWRSQTCT
ncbi:hypothetical protein RHM58_25990 [Pseudomonas sp. 10S4]|uniref:hypothetical protein n=1 Tax=Pseudomonas sp. 10S4 TaxID=3048583 RepID=UPI002AC90461|nr:hypothetical protein [Pseudomonas sp. 10S4]WPX17319.1 hypothetical protein RHM58_25990 [Pseudomonas sp. 10S4]